DPRPLQLVGHRRDLPRSGIRRAGRRVTRQRVLAQRPLQHRSPAGAEIARPRVQAIVQPLEVVAEGGREERRRPFDRGEFHSRRHEQRTFRMATARLSMAECPRLPGMIRRFRGMGKGRKTRRALGRGGAGPAKRLNETLAEWSGVRITPMFGRWGYFVGETLFGCFPLREKERDLWVRLSDGAHARALREPA